MLLFKTNIIIFKFLMDKNKIKFVTLDELKKIDSSLINYMTFTDGSVAIVNSGNEDEHFNLGDLKNDPFSLNEKEPDIQNDPNMYMNFEEENDIKKDNSSKNKRTYIDPSNNYNINGYYGYKTEKYIIKRRQYNNLQGNQYINNEKNHKLFISNDKTNYQSRKNHISNQYLYRNINNRQNISFNTYKSNSINSYKNNFMYESKYSSKKSFTNKQNSSHYNQRRFGYK